jgi:Asp-tRNA(Asn)/Glu-tRNA(Gln) amidotransferase A subunit family amidase
MSAHADAFAGSSLREGLNRRDFLGYFSGIGLSGTLLPGVLWSRIQERQEITAEVLAEAEKIAGLRFTEEQREEMVRGLNGNLRNYDALRAVSIPNEVPPALHFDPVLPHMTVPSLAQPGRPSRAPLVQRPANLEEAAFWPLVHLAELVRSRQVTSEDLTRMYLDRLKRHGPTLECVVTLTEERALGQARRADEEMAVGRYRGPLHGIPWGAKDLLAVRGYPTTWGARPYAEQNIDADAEVVRRLDGAGAVLVAKLTLGALAMGDVWFDGRTRNPWNLDQGSSGSSAGSAAATVAGLVGFAIGSETLGSIVSPSTRCGSSGLRPTFGRVSRAGAMALSWSMDKLGPICRTVEDCALVLDAIHGADGVDPTARTVPFNWDAGKPLSEIRIGYYRSAFDEGTSRTRELDLRALGALRSLGVDPIPLDLPEGFPVGALRIILNAESAAAFDDLTRSGRDSLLVRQDSGAWPNIFRQARMIPAVEFIQANRIRTMIMGALGRSHGRHRRFHGPLLLGQPTPHDEPHGAPGGGGPLGVRRGREPGECLVRRKPMGGCRCPPGSEGLAGCHGAPPSEAAPFCIGRPARRTPPRGRAEPLGMMLTHWSHGGS